MEKDDYSDIINMSRPKSLGFPRMSMYKRAAQFSAFEALDGHSERIHDAEQDGESWDEHDMFDDIYDDNN